MDFDTGDFELLESCVMCMNALDNFPHTQEHSGLGLWVTQMCFVENQALNVMLLTWLQGLFRPHLSAEPVNSIQMCSEIQVWDKL